jgi:hypothetical protein
MIYFPPVGSRPPTSITGVETKRVYLHGPMPHRIIQPTVPDETELLR